MAANWTKIESEYVTGSMGYRELAKKHHLDLTTVAREGKKGNWVQKRKQFALKAQTKIENAVATSMADRAQKVLAASDRLLSKVTQYVDTLDPQKATGKDLQAVAGALRGIKELQDLRSDLDIQEQEARIANLRKAAEKDDTPPGLDVTLGEELNDFAH